MTTCTVCGADFEPLHKNHQTCSPECRAKRAAAIRRNPDLKREITCQTCGTLYKPYRSGQKNCSPECGQQATRKRLLRGVRAEEGPAPPDDQMARLFRNYKERQSIAVEDREDGTRVMVISDAQIPFIDEPLWETVLRFMGDFRPHDLIINGDWLDAYEISDFDKRPERLFNLQTEFEMASDTLDDARKRIAKDGKVFWIDGNHEERLNRAIWKHAAGFAFLVSDISAGLRLEERCAGYVPYGKHVDYLGFTITHGNFVSAQSAYTAKRHADRYHSSGCNGHTHRAGSYSYTDMHNRSHTWYEIGCLCRKDLEYVKGTANWQHAFMVGTVRGGALHPQLVRVIETDSGRGFTYAGDYYEVND